MDTTTAHTGAIAKKKKGRVFTRPFGTFPTLEVSALTYFGVVGAAGFAAPVPVDGLVIAGFATPDALGAGAATPDCTL